MNITQRRTEPRSNTVCPRVSELLRLVQGELPSKRSREIVRHCKRCSKCCSRLTSICEAAVSANRKGKLPLPVPYGMPSYPLADSSAFKSPKIEKTKTRRPRRTTFQPLLAFTILVIVGLASYHLVRGPAERDPSQALVGME